MADAAKSETKDRNRDGDIGQKKRSQKKTTEDRRVISRVGSAPPSCLHGARWPSLFAGFLFFSDASTLE